MQSGWPAHMCVKFVCVRVSWINIYLCVSSCVARWAHVRIFGKKFTKYTVLLAGKSTVLLAGKSHKCVCMCLMHIYTWCIYLALAIPTYMLYIYGSGQPYIYVIYIRLWPTLHVWCIYTALANPTCMVYIYGSGHPYTYGVYTWPTLHEWCIYTALANPTCMVYIYMANPTCMVHIYGSGHPYIYGVHVRLWPTPQSLPATAATWRGPSPCLLKTCPCIVPRATAAASWPVAIAHPATQQKWRAVFFSRSCVHDGWSADLFDEAYLVQWLMGACMWA